MPEKYKVRPGDCTASIAYQRGFFQDTIWNYPDNAALKSKRKDPHILLPGDEVLIPDKRVAEREKPDGQRHRFRRKGVPKFLRIQLMENNKPVAHAGFQLTLDGLHFRGQTDGQGWLKQPIAPDAKSARLRFDNGAEYQLDLGQLDPIDTVQGVQQRLAGLRHYAGPIDGKMSSKTSAAIESFQLVQELKVTGEASEETKNDLVKCFGG